MNSDKRIAVLVSGGLESAILIDFFRQQFRTVFPVYIQSGHVWEQAELYWLKRFLRSVAGSGLKPLTLLSFSTKDLYRNHWSLSGRNTPSAVSQDEAVYLPGKNLLLLAKTAVFCSLQEIHHIGLGPLKTNPFADARKLFFRMMERTCSEGLNYSVQIHTPFLSKTKIQVMKLGKHLPFHLTFSCLNPHGTRHCGTCNKCAERKLAFQTANLPDPTVYLR